MGRRKQWIEHPIKDGIGTIEISSWKYFNNYICDKMTRSYDYCWRGQANSEWLLESSLDRVIKSMAVPLIETSINAHLDRFKFSTMGRRGPNPAQIVDENDWWALGQHYGLATPLLDWTTSPFVAAFFAFIEDFNYGVENRAIYALSRSLVEDKSLQIKSNFEADGMPPIIEFVYPFSDENTRLINQSGLFTRSPYRMNIETWVRNNFAGYNEYCVLGKFIISNKERDKCLNVLSKMNINYLTLFPDLFGSTNYCNYLLQELY